jgi:hypothetical protein
MDLSASLQISEKLKVTELFALVLLLIFITVLYCVILSCNGSHSYNMCLGVGLFCCMGVFLTFYLCICKFFQHKILLFVSYGIYFCIVVISLAYFVFTCLLF